MGIGYLLGKSVNGLVRLTINVFDIDKSRKIKKIDAEVDDIYQQVREIRAKTRAIRKWRREEQQRQVNAAVKMMRTKKRVLTDEETAALCQDYGL